MRNGFRHVRPCSEEGSVLSALIAQEISTFVKKLASQQLKLTFNMDGTGQSFKVFPLATNLSSKENWAIAWGTKGMRSKYRLTEVVSSNFDGLLNAPLGIIQNLKSPRCFQMQTPSCHSVSLASIP